MNVSIFTPTPQFANDLCDVVRIFWGGAAFFINESGQFHDMIFLIVGAGDFIGSSGNFKSNDGH